MGKLENGNEPFTMQEVESIHLKPFETMLLPRIATEAELYSSMQVSILVTDDVVGFITSDTPVVWFDPQAYKRPALYRSVGLGYPNVEVTLPLTPNILIYLVRFEDKNKA